MLPAIPSSLSPAVPPCRWRGYGVAPKVLKYSIPLANASAISGQQATAPSDVRFQWVCTHHHDIGTTAPVRSPEGLAYRPKPTCTSSAMQTPPASRACTGNRGAAPPAPQLRMDSATGDAPPCCCTFDAIGFCTCRVGWSRSSPRCSPDRGQGWGDVDPIRRSTPPLPSNL